MSTPGTQVQTVSVEDAAKLSSRNRVTDNDDDDDDDDAFFAVSAAAPKESKLVQGAADSQRQDPLANRSGNAAVTDEGQTGNERLGGGGGGGDDDEDEDEDAFRAAEKDLAIERRAFATPSVLPKFTLLAGSTLQERVTPEWRKRAMARPNMPLPPLFEEDEEGEDILPARKKVRKRKPRADRGKSRASAEAIVGGEEAAKVPRVPHLPDIFVKKVWTNLLKARDFSSDGNATARAVMRASAAFFEQAADDLASYADHGGRRTIEMSDVRCLFARQRLIAGDLDEALADLARKHLPREFADEVIDALE
ncbi:Centromere protein T [Hondaea fermentalgiana]|uniref:Centromere protein T n=1 Tax=Hondaea fermentalgiana TaxID=2315210 RepID=A0A2R5G6U7_9STRA|nr:Centromere protein T [Hondaea fermentalgiana]|eukprot:GBG25518.1 Centromere protein T [Hondaea fermentalgiana]